MLNNKNAIATVAVKDLKVAAKFYEGMLDLKKEAMEGEEAITYRTGNSLLNVYRSQHAGTNQATAVTWVVGDDLDGIVRGLKTKGVVFEHYDLPGMTPEGDVHLGGDLKVVWFKDPDGNILSFINR